MITQSTDPKYLAVRSVHLAAREATSTPVHLLLADYAARLEGAGFGQTEDERVVLAWIRRTARLPHGSLKGSTPVLFKQAWSRILDSYGIIPRVTAS